MDMQSILKLGSGLAAAFLLSGCITETFEGTERYRGSESVIATGQDQGKDTGILVNGRAAIAYDAVTGALADEYLAERTGSISGNSEVSEKRPCSTISR